MARYARLKWKKRDRKFYVPMSVSAENGNRKFWNSGHSLGKNIEFNFEKAKIMARQSVSRYYFCKERVKI